MKFAHLVFKGLYASAATHRKGENKGVETMVSRIAIGAAIAAAAIGAAPVAIADDVPGIDDDAVLGAPCANWDRYIFGRGPNGEPLPASRSMVRVNGFGPCHWWESAKSPHPV